MKKLMTAFAACMIAGLVSAQVESQNIVGYTTQISSAGFTAYTPMFNTVGAVTAGTTLGTVVGTFADFDTAQFLDAAGNVSATYQWLTVAGVGVPADGWYDDAFSPVDPAVAGGVGFLLSTAGAADVLNSGEVSKVDAVVTAAVGFTCVGNSTPVDINLSGITFAGLSDFDTAQFLDAAGNVSATYQWLTVAGVGVPADGWYDDAFSPVDPVVVVGQAFLLSAAAGGTVTIPAAI